MTSKRFDTHDPEGGFQKIRSFGSRGSKEKNRVGKMVSVVEEGVRSGLVRESEVDKSQVVVLPATRYKDLRRIVLKREGRVDGNKPERLLVHRIMADVSPGGGVEITEPDDKRMDKWKW